MSGGPSWFGGGVQTWALLNHSLLTARTTCTADAVEAATSSKATNHVNRLAS
jgi:hypothetical protein